MKFKSDAIWKQVVGKLVAAYAADPDALKKMSGPEVNILYFEKMLDRREMTAKLQLNPGDELAALRLAQADRDANDIADFLKQTQRAPKVSILEQLRQEIEGDTKAAQAEPERLARRRADKEQGPIEVPKKDKDRGMER
jgi:hypothetical protein